MQFSKDKSLKEKIIEKIAKEGNFLSLKTLLNTSKIDFDEDGSVVLLPSGSYNFKVAEKNFRLLSRIVIGFKYKSFKILEPKPVLNIPRNVPVTTKPVKKKEPKIFETFHPYHGVKNAFRAIDSLVAENGGNSLFPILLYGPPGVGKTHLLNFASFGFDEEVVGSDQFTERLVGSVEKQNLNGFKSSFFRKSSLLVDDIQKFVGRKRTLQVFFDVFDSFLVRSRPIVVVSDRHPRTIEHFSPRLISRLTSGLVIKMSPPEEDERKMLLEKFILKKTQKRIPAGLFKNLPPDVRGLKGIAGRFLWSESIGNPEEYSVSFALSQDTSLPGSSILDDVCRVFNVTKSSLLSGSRQREIVLARQAAVLLLCCRPNGCKASSSRTLNVKKSAITYSLRKSKKTLKENEVFKNSVNSIAVNHGFSLDSLTSEKTLPDGGNLTLF
tara:strand:+ start:2054 stop:3367 length:1314 start_codon:yes stop_codon:yes gene_type:complete